VHLGSVGASEKEAGRYFTKSRVTVERGDDSALRKGLRWKSV